MNAVVSELVYQGQVISEVYEDGSVKHLSPIPERLRFGDLQWSTPKSKMLDYNRRQYLLAAELRRLLSEYDDICDGPTLEALGMAAGRASTLAESASHFDWNTVKPREP